MENQANDQQDQELEEATKGLEPPDGSVEEEKFEDIGEIEPEETQVPEVDLKPLQKGLMYESCKTYTVIVSDDLSPEENEKFLNLLKNIGRQLDIRSMFSKVLAQPFAPILYLWKTNVSP
jgi:transcription initiation factor IIF auxiliary subunit